VSEEHDARRRLAALPGFDAKTAAAARLTRLAGLTNRVFKVETATESFCLRIPGVGTDSIIDRRVEERNARAAAAAGITPEVLHFAEDGTMLTRFVHGALVTPEHLRDSPEALQRVAMALRSLHCRAPDFAGVFHVFEIMQSYAALLESRGAAMPEGAHAVLGEADAVRGALAARPAPLRPCHCDPTGRNLIDTGERVWLVDWEYAAMNDPMWDLAYFSVESELDDKADAILLTAYLAREPDKAESARMAVTKAVCELLAALWALVQQAEGNRTTDFAIYAGASFARAARRMAAPEFAKDLATLHHD
jgi:thiamine kinase-like enzyme